MLKILKRILGTVETTQNTDGSFQKISYKNGKRNGDGVWYFKNGQIREKYTYKDDKMDGPFEEYYENGQLCRKGAYVDDERDGPYVEYYSDGQLYMQWIYKDGKLEGPCVRYHDNGQIEEKCTYIDGKKEGSSEEYHDNGQLQRKYTYKDGKKNGPYEYFYENGRLGAKCIFKNDDVCGIAEEYRQDGQLDKITINQNGEAIDVKYRFLTPEEVLPDWEKEHQNLTTEDFIGYMYGTGGNVITCLVRSGYETLEKFFPMDKWATMEAIPELKKIFATVPREEELMETMSLFDSKLRTTYNLNQRKQARKKQTSKKTITNQGGR